VGGEDEEEEGNEVEGEGKDGDDVLDAGVGRSGTFGRVGGEERRGGGGVLFGRNETRKMSVDVTSELEGYPAEREEGRRVSEW
jgi:hypothetical protein